MSADNGTYVLAYTNANTCQVEYRIAMAFAIENIDEDEGILKSLFGKSKVFHNGDIAMAEAKVFENKYHTEYGVVFLDRKESYLRFENAYNQNDTSCNKQEDGLYIVWSPSGNTNPSKRFTSLASATVEAERLVMQHKNPFYVMKAVSVTEAFVTTKKL